jgi:hypothetical protein
MRSSFGCGSAALRFSGSPTQLAKEARYRRVRCKRLFGIGADTRSLPEPIFPSGDQEQERDADRKQKHSTKNVIHASIAAAISALRTDAGTETHQYY